MCSCDVITEQQQHVEAPLTAQVGLQNRIVMTNYTPVEYQGNLLLKTVDNNSTIDSNHTNVNSSGIVLIFISFEDIKVYL